MSACNRAAGWDAFGASNAESTDGVNRSGGLRTTAHTRYDLQDTRYEIRSDPERIKGSIGWDSHETHEDSVA
jgi:hypothetical protein